MRNDNWSTSQWDVISALVVELVPVIWYYNIYNMLYYQKTSPGSGCPMGAKQRSPWIPTRLLCIGGNSPRLCIQQAFCFLSSVFYHSPFILGQLQKLFDVVFKILIASISSSKTLFLNWLLYLSCSYLFCLNRWLIGRLYPILLLLGLLSPILF